MGEVRVITLEDIHKYGRKYAVLVEGKIVAASENPAEEYREVRKKYSGRRVVLTYIPTEKSLVSY